MTSREFLVRQFTIIKKLKKSEKATYQEIADYLEQEAKMSGDKLTISKRTFSRDINDIRSLFDIDIKCNSFYEYYIDSEGEPGFSNRLMEMADMLRFLHIASDLSPYFHFDKRKVRGEEYLYDLLNAIKNRNVISYKYQKMHEDEPTQRVAEPYHLKEYKNRWYIIAKDNKDEDYKVFGLDRIFDLSVTKKKFKRNNEFNADEKFRHCFGIFTPNNPKQEPEEVVLSFTRGAGNFIKSLPLHESQEILEDNKKELRIKLTLHLERDFILELLSYSDELTVIAPLSLREQMRGIFEKAMRNNG